MSQQQQHHHYQQHQSEGGRSVESAPSSFGIEQRMAQLLVSTQQNPIPIQQQQQQQQHRPRQLITPLVTGQRPYDELGRPPQNPRPFERPQYGKGRRCEVLCYNPLDDSHSQLKNVLLRDPPMSGDLGGRVEENSTNRSNNRLFPGSVGSPNQSTNKNNNTMCAYYPSPFKEPIKTIMGHVEICNVLERIQRQRDDDFDDDDESDSSIDDEDDIVFQWTDRLVAVKVNSIETMTRLRGKHAEDPNKEIAAMQLIGTTHPHVLGCIDALFDGKNLNVVMPYCDSGDLFQLLQDTQEYNAKLDDPNSPPGLSEGQSRYWFRQLMRGVQHMHSEAGVCHRDLSPENVMIDQNRFSVIIDLGMCLRVPYQVYQDPIQPGTLLQIVDLKTAKRMGTRPAPSSVSDMTSTSDTTLPVTRINTNGDTSTGNANLVHRRCILAPQGTCGKMPYMCPEIYRNRDPFDGEAADIWTAGTILFCMITGNRSYQRPHSSDPQFYWMTMGIEQLLRDWNVQMSAEGIHLLKNMLKIDPRARLTLQEVINHPWFDFPDEVPTVPVTETMDLDLDDSDDDE